MGRCVADADDFRALARVDNGELYVEGPRRYKYSSFGKQASPMSGFKPASGLRPGHGGACSRWLCQRRSEHHVAEQILLSVLKPLGDRLNLLRAYGEGL